MSEQQPHDARLCTGCSSQPQPESAHHQHPACCTLAGSPVPLTICSLKEGSASPRQRARTCAGLGGTSMVSAAGTSPPTEPLLGQQLAPEPFPAPKSAERQEILCSPARHQPSPKNHRASQTFPLRHPFWPEPILQNRSPGAESLTRGP